MKVYKFGGASVKDPNGVKNVVRILQNNDNQDIIVVISAMGKMTNALEEVVYNYLQNKELLPQSLATVQEFHQQMAQALFQGEALAQAQERLQQLFNELSSFLTWNKSPKHSFVYDQIVSFGELLSTTIISLYLTQEGIKNTWLDVRTMIKTDSNYRDANVLWDETQQQIKQNISKGIFITQGFLGSDANFFATTLGREGSDYSAAIFAYCLDAESVTIWKDVPGVLNADPRYFSQTQLLEQIPYQEAIELAFYGASVIHPKTLQPLQQKEIPLFVRSFLHPEKQGSAVCNISALSPKVPCLILKENQHLISLSSRDFSFIMEDGISFIFSVLSKHKVKVSLIQNSAISFSVCVGDKFGNLADLLSDLQQKFKIECTENVRLYTIRHANEQAVALIEQGREILLKQVLENTVQIVTR